MPGTVFITAAELSGDQHAASLIRHMRNLDGSLQIEGHGGRQMREAGAAVFREITRSAVMGLRGALRLREGLELLRWTRQHFDRHRPDLLICIDSPDLNLHFARMAHKRGIPVLYYIAPQVWAWRQGRVAKIRRWVDHVACILPFEEQYFRVRGIPATFVGHPLFDRNLKRQTAAGPRFPNRPPVLGLLAGSRLSEARANFPHLLEVARQICKEFPQASFLSPTTEATHPVVEQVSRGFDRIRIATDAFDEMVPQCDLCLTVSGTATLHVASYGIPMIAVYRASRVLWHLVGRWLIKTRTFCLVNLLTEQPGHIVPEYIPWYGSDRAVAEHAIDFLRHPEKLQQQRERLLAVVRKLDHPGASQNVARLALQLLRDDRQQTGEPAVTRLVNKY